MGDRQLEGLIVFDVGSFFAPAAVALEILGLRIFEYWVIAPDSSAVAQSAKIGGRYKFCSSPQAVHVHFLRERLSLFPDATCGLVFSGSCFLDNEVMQLWERILGTFPDRSWAALYFNNFQPIMSYESSATFSDFVFFAGSAHFQSHGTQSRVKDGGSFLLMQGRLVLAQCYSFSIASSLVGA